MSLMWDTLVKAMTHACEFKMSIGIPHYEFVSPLWNFTLKALDQWNKSDKTEFIPQQAEISTNF